MEATDTKVLTLFVQEKSFRRKELLVAILNGILLNENTCLVLITFLPPRPYIIGGRASPNISYEGSRIAPCLLLTLTKPLPRAIPWLIIQNTSLYITVILAISTFTTTQAACPTIAPPHPRPPTNLRHTLDNLLVETFSAKTRPKKQLILLPRKHLPSNERTSPCVFIDIKQLTFCPPQTIFRARKQLHECTIAPVPILIIVVHLCIEGTCLLLRHRLRSILL